MTPERKGFKLKSLKKNYNFFDNLKEIDSRCEFDQFEGKKEKVENWKRKNLKLKGTGWNLNIWPVCSWKTERKVENKI